MGNAIHVIPRDRVVHTETVISVTTCASCGIDFGIGVNFERIRREDKATFYCPNGHGLHFSGPTEAEIEATQLRRRLESAEATAQSWRDQATAAEASRRAQKAANTKLKKRIAAGVCPCCKRSFQNLGRHMAGQHPDYTTDQS